MKIALVCRYFTLKKGGLEKYTVFLSRALSKKGHEVHVFANTFMKESGVVFHHVPVIRLSLPVKNLSFAYLLQKRLQTEPFDIIHSMERTFYQDIFRVSDGINPVQMQQRYSNPKIRFIKALGPRRLVLSWLEQKIFLKNGCRAVMTNSRLVRRNILDHYNINPNKITVIYNGVDTSRFHPKVKIDLRESARMTFGFLPEEIVLLFISNNFKLKQLSLVLKAMAILKDSSFKLIAIGSDNPKPYQRWAAKNGLSKQVFFPGAQKKVENYYAASDIFVLPTLYDAFANVCLEAMACGLPVLTTGSNGAAELVSDGIHGYVLKSSEAEELAGHLVHLKSAPERNRMGRQAAKKASAYTLDKHLSALLNLYDRIYSTKSR
ncbi:MAG: glycosyltransferase family 4 protein [Desulfobacterales bacterium]